MLLSRFSFILHVTGSEKPETPKTTTGHHNLNTDQLCGMDDVLGHGGMQYRTLTEVSPLPPCCTGRTENTTTIE